MGMVWCMAGGGIVDAGGDLRKTLGGEFLVLELASDLRRMLKRVRCAAIGNISLIGVLGGCGNRGISLSPVSTDGVDSI